MTRLHEDPQPRTCAVLCGGLLLLLWSGSASAQATTTFAWTASVPPPVPDGYVLALGSQPGAIDTEVDAGPNLQVTVTVPVGTWYARAYAYVGTQWSGPSNELTLTVDPSVDVCTTTPLTVTVTQWPLRKLPLRYTASQPIVSVQYVKQKRTVVGAIFIDDRGCAVTVMRGQAGTTIRTALEDRGARP